METIFMEVLQNDPESVDPQLLQQQSLPTLGDFSIQAPKKHNRTQSDDLHRFDRRSNFRGRSSWLL